VCVRESARERNREKEREGGVLSVEARPVLLDPVLEDQRLTVRAAPIPCTGVTRE